MTLRNQFEGWKRKIAQRVLESGLLLEGRMHQLVAIKTGTLDESIFTDRVKESGSIFSIEVGTEGVFYAGFVEFGVSRIYNYHRDGAVVWTGIGQHFTSRSIEDTRGEILGILRGGGAGGAIVF